eukprot:gnl/Spiro4/18850_TR10074_c0_g1_i1.p2 gnl/Spiro4/18850_TR10074_c0_g1~~gnl/Spiro4/18850_TR10074_c0_g1_i1.p2  ORF type:complete len:102 (-),score=18.55 gnl/Spiro4/18850_TR10074_c0_g1_i1:74-346(-)
MAAIVLHGIKNRMPGPGPSSSYVILDAALPGEPTSLQFLGATYPVAHEEGGYMSRRVNFGDAGDGDTVPARLTLSDGRVVDVSISVMCVC